MERAPGVQMEYEHVVLRTDRTADLQEAILDASASRLLKNPGDRAVFWFVVQMYAS